MEGLRYKIYFMISVRELSKLLVKINKLSEEGNHVEQIYGPNSLLNMWTAILYEWVMEEEDVLDCDEEETQEAYEGPMEPPDEVEEARENSGDVMPLVEDPYIKGIREEEE